MYRSYLSINAALVERNHSVIRVLPIGSTTKKLGISLWLCLMQWYHNKKNLVLGGVVQASYHIPTTFSLLCIGTSGATRGGAKLGSPPHLTPAWLWLWTIFYKILSMKKKYQKICLALRTEFLIQEI